MKEGEDLKMEDDQDNDIEEGSSESVSSFEEDKKEGGKK